MPNHPLNDTEGTAQLLARAGDTLSLAKYFESRDNQTFVYHTLLREFPRGTFYGRLYRRLKSETPSFPYEYVGECLRKLNENGLVKKSGSSRPFVYEAIPIEDPVVREVFEKHKDSVSVCIELERIYFNHINGSV